MSLWRRVAVVLLSAVALFATANLLGAGIDALFAAWGSKAERVPTLPPPAFCSEPSKLGTAQRQVKLLTDGKEVTLQLNLTLPVDDPCVRSAFSGALQASLDPFIKVAFGDVHLNGKPLSADDLKLSTFREPGQPNALIQLERIVPLDGFVSLWVNRELKFGPATDEVLTILQPGVRVRSVSPVPDSRTPEMLVLRALQPGGIPSFFIALEASPDPAGGAAAAAPPPPPARQQTRQEFLFRLGTIEPFKVLGSLLSGLHLSMPLLLALLWFWRAPVQPLTAAPLARLTAALFLFYASYYALISMNGFRQTEAFFEAGRRATEWIVFEFRPRSIGPLGHDFPIAISAILGIGVPVLVRRLLSAGRTRPAGARWSTLGTVVLASGALVALGGTLWNGDLSQAGLGKILLAVGTALALFTGFLTTLFVGLTPGNASPTLASACALAVVVLKVGDSLLLGTPWRQPFWLAVASLLGAFLLRSLAAAVSIEARTFFRRPAWADRRDVRLVSALLLLLIAVPLPALSLKDLGLAGANSVGNLAFFLLPWVLPIWLLGGLAFLSREGRNGLELSSAAHALGLLALSTALFSPRIYWFYLPITFLLGWLTLDRILVKESSASSIPALRDLLARKRAQLFEAILDRNASDQAVRAHRRKKLEELLAGEVDFDTYEQECHTRAAKAESLRQRALEDGQDASHLALALAPHATAWENGMHGALFGALFGLPWIAFGLASLLRNPAFRSPNPLLDLGADVVFVILRWVAAGFLLGYFFPYLRGRSGLVKGFFLFLALTLPTLSIAVMQNTTAAQWQPTLFLYLQTFIHCMLLGLFAFDLAALRAAGFRDWRVLFELHGLPALGLSLSSLAVAIGAAITTLLSSQLSSLVGAALRVALPAAPELPQ